MAVVITQTANPAGVNSSSNIATYSSVDIGTAAPKRVVVVLVGVEATGATIDSCTIDFGSGDTAMSAGTQGNQGIVYARAFYLTVPTGTTGTIKVTFGGGAPGSTNNHIAVYSVTPAIYSSTGADASTDMDSTDPLTTGSTTIAAGGGMIAIAAGALDTNAKTWANLGEDLDVDAGAFRFTTAFSTTAGTATRTCTGTSTGEDGAMSWLIFTENTAPTVALNSPADASSDSDTTPTLDFTGTDADGDDVRYQVQIHTSSLFTESNYYFDASNDGPNNTGFTDPANGFDNDVNTFASSSTGSINARGTTAPLAGTTISLVEVRVKRTQTTTSSINTRQLVIRDGDAGSNLLIQDEATLATAAYTNYYTVPAPGGGWTWGKIQDLRAFYGPSSNNGVPTSNLYIIELKVTHASLIDKISGTDSGFANPDNGGDTDPFTTGENIQFTVQAGDALAAGTYYWRVRGLDPSGSNTYGAWSSTRSFTVTAGGGAVQVTGPFMTTNTGFWGS